MIVKKQIKKRDMLEKCHNKCTRALITLKSTTLFATIQDFCNSVESIQDSPEMLRNFYEYLKTKYVIPCEAGMLFIEMLTMLDLFDKYKLRKDQKNLFVNEKMLLYQWIEPRHLDIHIDISSLSEDFKMIETSNVPSMKITYLMKGIRKIYKSHWKRKRTRRVLS